MVTQEMIDRINTLYHKSQATGLTEEEKAEQAESGILSGRRVIPAFISFSFRRRPAAQGASELL